MCTAPDSDTHIQELCSSGAPSASLEALCGVSTSPRRGSNSNSCVEVFRSLRTKPASSGSDPVTGGAGTYSISRQKEGR